MKDYRWMRRWQPHYPRQKDKRVALANAELQTFVSNGHPGITVADYPLDGPACFWTDSTHLYVRVNWAQWCTVSTSCPDHLASICDAPFCHIVHSLNNTVAEITVPVLHIRELPPELFQQPSDPDDDDDDDDRATDDEDGEDSSSPDTLESSLLPGEESDTPEIREATLAEMRSLVDAEVARREWRLLARFDPEPSRDGTHFPFDIVQCGARCIVAVYCARRATWLADEDPFCGNPPMWFSEEDHMVSPVFFSRRCREYFARNLKGVEIKAVVVFPESCSILNEGEMKSSWKRLRHTGVVRVGRTDDSSLPTLREYLSSLPASGCDSLAVDPSMVSALADRFALAFP